jgi:glutathione synthase
MHIVVIMDPPETVVVDSDTSFALMLEAERRGHRVDHCMANDLVIDGGHLYARTRQAHMSREAPQPVTLSEQMRISMHDVDLVLVRTDPPFDTAYWSCTLMLDRLAGQVPVVNAPDGLRRANEKLYACYFPELMPHTLVTSERKRIVEFVDEVGGKAVMKSLSGHGGSGVMALRNGDDNFNSIVEGMTAHGTQLVMLQEYLPAVRDGDKRVLVLDGEPLGAVLRRPQGGDLRSNLHVGGKAVKAPVDETDRRIVETIAPRLRKDGLSFVGLDVIGGKLTEINVTSPTGIQQMSRLDDKDYCATVIDWLERHAGVR